MCNREKLRDTNELRVVAVIDSDGEIPDCVAESIDCNRKKLHQLEFMAKTFVQSLSSIRSRVYDVFYAFPIDGGIVPNHDGSPDCRYRLIPTFTVHLFFILALVTMYVLSLTVKRIHALSYQTTKAFWQS